MLPSSASRGVSLVTGFFERLGSPVSARSKRDEDEQPSSRPLPVTHLVSYVLLPVALFFLAFQGYLGYRSYLLTGSSKALKLAELPTARINETILRQLQNEYLRGNHLGYVEATIPESVVHFLAEAEKDLLSGTVGEAQEEVEVDELAKGAFTVEAEAYMERLTPPKTLGPVVSKPFPKKPRYSKKEEFELIWSYDMEEKEVPYTGNKFWMDQFEKDSRSYLNSLATFAYVSNSAPYRYHGLVGVYPNGTQAWNPPPTPPPVNDAPQGRKEAMKKGGFYLDMANALPLDREPDDTRDEICKTVQYDHKELGDASIVITFFNEPLSTLMRSVHSVLNQTPPPLLREIILVDDHSNLTENMPGSDLYEYIRLMPKVKLMRLPERRGLVWARLAGAQAAKSDVLVVLDSHIEVNRGWLEPQLQRLKESPKSIVFPQIFGLDAEDFTYHRTSGIGCWLSWKWNMVEQASLTGELKKTDPIPSASMAGGLFAVRLDWFWEIGGYDELFAMWGSENVEMGFRVWSCGGRMECTPCARTYHIYRKDGVGYSSPGDAVQRNKLRTARLWMDEWYQIAIKFIGRVNVDMGNLDNVLALKERLQCKPFKWFLDNVDPKHEAHELTDIEIFGEIRNVKHSNYCVDLVNGIQANVTVGVFGCHGLDGTQGFFKDKNHKRIRSFLSESKCLVSVNKVLMVWHCHESHVSDKWRVINGTQLAFATSQKEELCLAIETKDNKKEPVFVKCDKDDESQQWKLQQFEPDPNYAPPDFSIEYKKVHGLLDTSKDR
eukprot:Blabericola_migrator_1__4467@NODE_238_length_10988_cov_97_569087_g202_i0_p1_GENE_NODE_238_length_10988_cov_97_569087_g202_i0NODE_238_length_10988_cov_97_569087_g202_i0_p1_ORF_typecomplete_len777_score153_22Glycos_transf_2/PF00535_26/1_9e23Glyco_tranf_2_3/PF13641_6/7_7e22Ricin_B_lectin/PF00652_22/2_9e16Glyco_transf_7C/PF02709_14/1_4e14Glyco_tranf_2_2/PF10111_9/8_7e11Glyco_transf_21/PF13506_6/3_3e05GlcNAc/PF11397_8/0_03CDtoxinA/PF03498_14/1_7e02CDtoxinA/PF03498_14/0_04_NODE_238_length_10988_cov_97